MAKCKSCGKPVKWGQNLCSECASLDKRNKNEEVVKRLGSVPVHCDITITDVATKSGSILVLGDLFLTSGGLVYIPLTEEPAYFGPLSMVPRLLDATALGVVSVFLPFPDPTSVQSAKYSARGARQQDLTASIEERIRKRGGIVVPQSEIESTTVEDKIVRVRYSGGYLDMAVKDPQGCLQNINRWISGL